MMSKITDPAVYETIATDNLPRSYRELAKEGEAINFSMPSELSCGQLLRTLVASKPGGNFLELGTGIGLSLSWMVDGMDHQSSILSIDNDPSLIEIVEKYFSSEQRVEIICADGSEWLKNYAGEGFDLIFADTWPGKYWDVELALDLINPGGIYLIDDMLPQNNWPEGHDKKAMDLISFLKNLKNFHTTMLNWSTGIVICTKSIK